MKTNEPGESSKKKKGRPWSGVYSKYKNEGLGDLISDAVEHVVDLSNKIELPEEKNRFNHLDPSGAE